MCMCLLITNVIDESGYWYLQEVNSHTIRFRQDWFAYKGSKVSECSRYMGEVNLVNRYDLQNKLSGDSGKSSGENLVSWPTNTRYYAKMTISADRQRSASVRQHVTRPCIMMVMKSTCSCGHISYHWLMMWGGPTILDINGPLLSR